MYVLDMETEIRSAGTNFLVSKWWYVTRLKLQKAKQLQILGKMWTRRDLNP